MMSEIRKIKIKEIEAKKNEYIEYCNKFNMKPDQVSIDQMDRVINIIKE